MKRSRRPDSTSRTSSGSASRSPADSIHSTPSGPTEHLYSPLIKYTSPVPTRFSGQTSSNGYRSRTTLPLNLIAAIISFLDDPADLARVTRTSRLLHYMTLPQLYHRVHLHSYSETRYVNGKPEGFGSGSPFMMALNGLATKSHAALVSELRLWGQWKELGIEDFAKGVIPNGTIMLGIILRAAIDKMVRLNSFSWELDSSPTKTLYLGLAARDTLTSLTLRFPSARVPRPFVLIPPMQNLRSFKALDIDPLCYPDDISLLLLHSRELRDLRLHFSPRMRSEAENSLALSTFFGKCVQANYKLKLKHFALCNFFGPNDSGGLGQILDEESLESLTMLDVWGGTDPRTVWVDESWKRIEKTPGPSLKRVRINEVSGAHIRLSSQSKLGVERMYLVNAKRPRTGYTPSASAGSSCTPGALTTPSPDTSSTPVDPDYEEVAICKEYLGSITQFHGHTLRHLLLRDIWALDEDDVAMLVRRCPNLEQLGVAIKDADQSILMRHMPFLTKLRALRILYNDSLVERMRTLSHEEIILGLEPALARPPIPVIEVIGLGDVIYKIGRVVEKQSEDGFIEARREITFGDASEPSRWEIWRLDTLDIGADPIAE
ncbi:unnamed protein product [Zymoseptoria tritici ST99CH_1E4]|uniref:F-box domain-containing protein n=2 Tax=Zymoseptoria tritici TaxID=1047171 RepID=A0A2H1FXW2_ZYMTR|nr:unnamed protein product [Zymoseptoria tritici ST99CH_1E4]